MIEGGIRSQSEIQQELDLESFSAGQLSRRLALLDTGEACPLVIPGSILSNWVGKPM